MSNALIDSPSPPRVRHAEGPTRYEKEIASTGEQKDSNEPKAIGEWRLGRTVGKGTSGSSHALQLFSVLQNN